MNITYINRTGKTHEIDGTQCEDSVYISEEPLVCCVADGVSNSRYGGAGASALTAEIGKCLGDAVFRKFVTEGRPADVSAALYEVISGCISRLCRRYSAQPDEFASTLLVLTSDGTTVTVMHAGDGAVFAKPRTAGGSVMVLSYPDNNEYGSVYHAGHPDTPERMRVVHLKQDELASVLLGTDGFTDAYLDSSYQAFDAVGLSSAFNCRNNRELEELVRTKHLGERRITDDISCVIVNFEDSSAGGRPLELHTQYRVMERQPQKRTVQHYAEAVETARAAAAAKRPENSEQSKLHGGRQPAAKGEPSELGAAHTHGEHGAHERKRKGLAAHIVTAVIILLLAGAVLLSLYNIYMAGRYADRLNESSSQLESMVEAAQGRLDGLESQLYAMYESEPETESETETQTDEAGTEAGLDRETDEDAGETGSSQAE